MKSAPRPLDPLEEAIAFAIREAARLKREQEQQRGTLRVVTDAKRRGKAA